MVFAIAGFIVVCFLVLYSSCLIARRADELWEMKDDQKKAEIIQNMKKMRNSS